ncbi:hemicentin-1-like isoform X2 [Trachinotus anak]|uniref:hemicentin-1-like isoform X2 n=1 Tax=Trachinotus anak TaxID=443729 RepID=UPI0039F2553F
MFSLQVTPTAMELLPLLCLCVLTRAGTTFADQHGPEIKVKEGRNVTLPCSATEDIALRRFEWKKDDQKEVFVFDSGLDSNNGLSGQYVQFKGRVSYFSGELKNGNASITIRETKAADSGNYTCEIRHLPDQKFLIKLLVGPEIIVTEGRNVTLPCSTTEDIGLRRFEWKKDDQKEVFVFDGSVLSGQDEQFKGRVSHFPGELKNGNASITIRDTKVADSGVYTCEIRLKDPPIQKFLIKLLVGAAPELSIKILGETQDGVQLQCVVHGASPKPKVQWQDGAGNILPAKEPQVSERGDVILQTTVTKTDHYRCVATQEEINHQIHAEIYVLMNSAVSKPSIMILGEREDRVQLQCEVHGASPKPKVQWQDRAGNILPAKEPQVSERGGSYDIILQTTVTKTDHYRCVATQEEINHQIYAETYVPVHGAAPEPSITTLDQTKDWALLQCVVRGASPKPKVQWQDSDGNILHAEESKVTERGGRYDIILQTTVTKTDHYRCVATQEEINHQIQAETFVHMSGAAPKPSVTILDETTDWALLQCEVHGASPKPEVRWQDGAGNILPAKEPQVSERGGSYDIILQTTVTKTDHYRCVATQEEIKHQIHAETYVHINGAAPLPYVTILGETQDGVQLQCVVRGASPKPKVQWQDGAGNILPAKEPLVSERGGRYDIILQTTVTKADHYQCVATQEEINHQINATIYVPVTGAVSKPFITTLGETQDGVQLQCEVRGASPKPKVQWQDRAGNILPAKEPQVSERGGSYDIILQTTVTKTDHYRCVATQEEINHQIHAETYVPVHGFSTGHVVTAVAAVLGTLLLVGVVVAVLRAKGCIKCSKGGAQTRVPHEDPNHLV